MIFPISELLCPLDGLSLTLSDRQWCCSNGHSFDVAKQGYVNLLPVQNKRSKDPGDSKAMVQARRRFLATQVYQPIAEAMTTLSLEHGPNAILDAGCGEGYYLKQLLQRADQQACDLQVAALDISKWAMQAAAKQDKRVTYMVASNAAIPLADNSIDVVLCVFGFPVESEFKRVLKPGGKVIMVDPGEEHLIELKRIIYEDIKAKPEALPIDDPQLLVTDQQRLSFNVQLANKETIADLLVMTPHLYRSSAAGRAKAEQLEQLSVTADVWLRTFVYHGE